MPLGMQMMTIHLVTWAARRLQGPPQVCTYMHACMASCPHSPMHHDPKPCTHPTTCIAQCEVTAADCDRCISIHCTSTSLPHHKYNQSSPHAPCHALHTQLCPSTTRMVPTSPSPELPHRPRTLSHDPSRCHSLTLATCVTIDHATAMPLCCASGCG